MQPSHWCFRGTEDANRCLAIGEVRELIAKDLREAIGLCPHGISLSAPHQDADQPGKWRIIEFLAVLQLCLGKSGIVVTGG